MTAVSEFRVEKTRMPAVVALANGATVAGFFFVSGSSATHLGPERVADVLNAEEGFFPFDVEEAGGARTVLLNRAQVRTVALEGHDEPRRDPGYEVATERPVSMLLSDGRRVAGTVRVYRPQGRDRLSDWARAPETFRYLETADGTLIVHVAHIIEVFESTPS